MMTPENVHTLPTRRSLPTVAVVSSHPHLQALEAVLGGLNHDVVFINAISQAYSQIKRGMPDVVVVCLTDDDEASCQVLSMLRLDRETARIPVLTYLQPPGTETDQELQEDDTFNGSGAVSMN